MQAHTRSQLGSICHGSRAGVLLLGIHTPLPRRIGRGTSTQRRISQAGSSNGASAAGSGGRVDGDLDPKHVVVVGAGWAGFGAAWAAASAGARVTLVDASPSPGGLAASLRTGSGRVIEPGIKGFWYPYRNIDALVRQLGIPSPYTEWTRSSMYTPQGLQVQSPVFGDQPRLPAPLGSFFYSSPYFTNLPLADRLSAVRLVGALLEHDASEDAYRRYDAMSAYDLFRSSGVTRDLYTRFLEPMLVAVLFAPPQELSAAAALGALYYFALAHQADFDVRWCRGPIGELIFAPLVERLRGMGVNIVGSSPVEEVAHAPGQAGRRFAVRCGGAAGATHAADALVFAVGVTAMQALTRRSPLIASAPELRAVNALGAVDVVAARLWLDRRVTPATPSNVVVGFDAGVGGTFFDLNALQDQYRDEAGSVVEVDLFHANTLLPLSDEQLTQKLLRGYLAACVPAYGQCKVLDAGIVRVRGGVTAFAPGSHQHMPQTAVGSLPGAFVAGDWLSQGPGSHGAKGLSQEKALVTGYLAGNAAAAHLGLRPKVTALPAEGDEPHVAAAKEAARWTSRLSAARL